MPYPHTRRARMLTTCPVAKQYEDAVHKVATTFCPHYLLARLRHLRGSAAEQHSDVPTHKAAAGGVACDASKSMFGWTRAPRCYATSENRHRICIRRGGSIVLTSCERRGRRNVRRRHCEKRVCAGDWRPRGVKSMPKSTCPTHIHVYW